MAIGFEAFDLAGKITLEGGDADKVLIRIHREAKKADSQLSALETTTKKASSAFQSLKTNAGQAADAMQRLSKFAAEAKSAAAGLTFRGLSDEIKQSVAATTALAKEERAVAQAKSATITAAIKEVQLAREKLKLTQEQQRAEAKAVKTAVTQKAPKDVLKTVANREIAAAETERRKQQKITESQITTSEQAIARIKKIQSTQSANAIIADLKRIERERKAAERQQQGNFSSGFTGRLGVGDVAFGAFAGGLAAGAVLGTVDAVKQLASATAQLGVASVQSAAAYQRLQFAMTAITGSSTLARDELAKIIELSRGTPGLSLQSAEEGVVRLRAVGFEAQETREILEGLSRVKLLSGASAADQNRVIYNLTQIKSLGRLTGDELRETLQALPAIAPVIERAFGTISTEKIKELGLSSQEFFAALLRELKTVPQVSGGAQDAFEKLTGELEIAKRSFGEPFLNPIADALRGLNTLLRDNQDSWGKWGQYIADVITGIPAKFDTVTPPPAPETPVGDQPLAQRALGLSDAEYRARWDKVNRSILTLGFDSFFDSFQREGEAVRKRVQEAAKEKKVRDLFGDLTQEGFTSEQIQSIDLEKIDKENAEAAKKLKDAQNAQVTNYKDTLKRFETEREIELARIETFYDRQINVASRGLRVTLEQELAYQKQTSVLREKQAAARIAERESEIAKTRALNEREIAALNPEFQERGRAQKELELQKQISDIERDKVKFQSEQIANQNQILELEKRIADAARQAAIEFANIQIEGIGRGLESQSADIERVLEAQTDSVENSFNQLVEINNSAFNRISRLTRENYERQLADESLTADQQRNIRAKMFLELEGLTENHNRKLLELDRRRYAEQINRLEQFSRRQQELFESQANVFGSISGFFQTDTFSRRSLEGFSDVFLGDSLSKEIDRLVKKRSEASNEVYNLRLKGAANLTNEEAKSVEKLHQRIEDLDAEIKKTNDSHTKFILTLTKEEEEIELLGQSLLTTASAFENFDKIAEKSLFAQQERELAAFNTQLDFARQKLNILSDQYGSQLTGSVRALESQIDSLEESQKTAPLGSLGDSTLRRLKAELEDAKKALDAFKLGTGKTSEILDAENAVRVLENALKSLTSRQAQERIELFSQSIAGLRETLRDLQTGDTATTNRLQNIFTRDLLDEQIDQYTEIEAIKFRLANTPLINTQEIEIAQLGEIIRLREIEQSRAADKAIRGNRVNILDSLSRQQREQALRDKQFEESRINAGRVAALARISGLSNEKEEAARIEREYHERSLKAEQDYIERLNNIRLSDGGVRRAATREDARDNSPFGSTVASGIRSSLGLDSLNTAIEDALDAEATAIEARGGVFDEAVIRTQTAAEAMKAVYQDLGDSVVGVFGQMASATESVLSNFILTGELGGAAFKQLAASIIASIVVQSGVKALFEVAEGIKEQALAAAALAVGNVPGAALHQAAAAAHFTAAKTYGLIAGGAAAVGIGIGAAGGLGGGSKGNPNEGQPDYFTNQQQAQNAINQPQRQISPEAVSSNNQGNVVQRVERAVEAFINRVESMPAGEVFMVGAKQNPGVFANRVVQELKTGGQGNLNDLRRLTGAN